MKNIKTFDTESEYQSYITGSTAVLPNLSYVKGSDEVYTTRALSITVTINVYETSEPTRIISSGLDDIKTIIIDGVKQETIQTGYTFSSTGEHTVKYLFKENVNGIPDSMFDVESESGGIVDVAKVKMSNGIMSIGEGAFYGCGVLTDITIPSSVTSIGSWALDSCENLKSIVFFPVTPPTLASGNAIDSRIDVIYVPSESVNTYKNAPYWVNFANLIEPM